MQETLESADMHGAQPIRTAAVHEQLENPCCAKQAQSRCPASTLVQQRIGRPQGGAFLQQSSAEACPSPELLSQAPSQPLPHRASAIQHPAAGWDRG